MLFSGGGTPQPLKGYHAPPAGGSGGRPPDGSKVSFFKTMQSIRNWIQFSKISTFFLPKNLFFLRKIYKNWPYFTIISELFRKIILKFHFLWCHINPEKFSVNSNSNWEIYKKKLKNSLDREGLLKMAWKFLKFLEKIDWNL